MRCIIEASRTPSVRRLLGAAVLAATTLQAGNAVAVPVVLDGHWSFDHSIVESEVTGHSNAVVDILGQDAYRVDSRVLRGGGGVHANALSSYYFPGAASVAVGTLNWYFGFEAPEQPLDVYMDWNTSLFLGASAILGSAGGGSQFEVTVYQERSTFPVPFPFPVGYLERIYYDSESESEVTMLAQLVAGSRWWLNVKFETGVATSTMSVIGIAAVADAFGFVGFDIWADDRQDPPPPAPVSEPDTPWLLGSALLLLAYTGRRTKAWPRGCGDGSRPAADLG